MKKIYNFYKKNWLFTKDEIFDFLDWYNFIDLNEIEMACCDFLENKQWFLYYWNVFDCEMIAQDYNENWYKRHLSK